MTPAAAPPAPVAPPEAAAPVATHEQRQAAYAATRPPIRALMARLDAERIARSGR